MKILIADDDPVNLRYLQSVLVEWGYEPMAVRNGPEALQALQGEDAPRIAILDWMMPGLDGVQICAEVRRQKENLHYTYLILLTARNQSQDIVEAMQSGADDFIAKPFVDGELQGRLRAAVRIVDLQQQLYQLASRDTLTGVWNRRMIFEDFERLTEEAVVKAMPISCLMLDLDHFKRINDSHGHATGDQVLVEVSRRIQSALRTLDRVGRYGGEEFLAILPGCGIEAAKRAAQRVIREVAGVPVRCAATTIAVSVSIGICTRLPGQALSVATMVSAADTALYRAKAEGRDRAVMAE
ncbi:MAG: diguanylate cyclase [Pseudomonadota bacterium]